MYKNEWDACSVGCLGLDLFEVSSAGPNTYQGFEIQRCDDCDRFEDDLEATRFVLDSAFAGDKRFQQMLRDLLTKVRE